MIPIFEDLKTYSFPAFNVTTKKNWLHIYIFSSAEVKSLGHGLNSARSQQQINKFQTSATTTFK